MPQALFFRAPLKSSEFIESILKIYREDITFVTDDRVLHDDINNSIDFIQSLDIDSEELFQ